MNQIDQAKTWDVLGFGAIAVDDFLYVDEYPAPDTKVRVQSRERHGGGLCATALIAAAKLGARCAFAGVLDTDELSQFSLRELKKYGLDCSQVLAARDARPAHSTIIVDENGTRTIFSDSSGLTPFPKSHITAHLLQNARVVFLDHTASENGALITSIAQAHSVPSVADIERNAPHLGDWIEAVDHLIVSEKFAREWTQSTNAIIAVQNLGESRRLAVVTCGENGCVACGEETSQQVLAVPAYRVNVVDTTGCGDVFHGAYAAELARGSDLETRLQIASALAAHKAQFRGGCGGLLMRDEILRWLDNF